MVLLEEITWDIETRTVKFELIEHPSYTGLVINRVDSQTAEDGSEVLYLTFERDWTFKGEGPDPLVVSMENAVNKSIAHIEAVYAKKL